MSLLASDRLEAFAAVAAEASFTRGGKRIGITQSAVSQRIAKLEEDLGTTLFIRARDSARLTAEGEALLRYTRAREGLEAEMLAGFAPNRGGGGVLRIGGFSSVTRSVLMPALDGLVHDGGALVLHVFSRELRELPALLRSGEADLVVIDHELNEGGFESTPLGVERNVLIESAAHPIRDGFLDHDPDDMTTERFFRLNERLHEFVGRPRSFLDDNYGILDGVARGWGRAVVSQQLVANVPGVRRVEGYAPLVTPVVLVVRQSAFRSQIEARAIDAIRAQCARDLA